MKVWVVLLAVFVTFQLIAGYPKGKAHLALEQLMKNKLHKPWHTTDKPQEYPRKGEYPCKAGICKTKHSSYQDLQEPVPLDVNWDYVKQ
ncbi:uncharacterized protein LOC121732641 [Aricia agestis]|uniref:uncharacterized protein LOC121732641 n=1 Tax=Aricia agestis TaxID=91739 RepID=UPI001C20ADD6|nr:uncharacterized protein LOC121732641 [Aricia agestis]